MDEPQLHASIMRNTIMSSANEGKDDDTRLVERIAPRMTCTVLDQGVSRTELFGDAVIEFEQAAPGNDVFVVDRRRGMHARAIGLEGVSEPG